MCPRHIKGHQDDIINLALLDRWALLNIEMDLEAKAWWEACKHNQSYFQYTIPKGMWKVSLLGNRVVNRLTSYLRESIEGGKVAEYWIKKKKKFTEESFFCVDWEAIKAAMGNVGPQRRRWVSKFEAGICATGPMMVH